MRYDAVIVGGGIAGLTSAAFLAKNGYKIMLCEKEDNVGGLVNSFYYDGFLFDTGARGIIDSGIVRPMLKQLDIDIEFVRSVVTIGIENELIRVETVDSLNDYREMLVKLYPEDEKDIDVILREIKTVMDYMDVIYGIENPLFKDLKKDKDYLFKTLFPWVFKFLAKSGKINKFNIPVYDYLSQLTDNQSLIDIISQHFFRKTPASFALSYFSLYLDYEYPVKGTFDLAENLKEYIIKSNGIIKRGTEIKKIDTLNKSIHDQNEQEYEYNQLIWAADTNQLYKAIDRETIRDRKVKEEIEGKRTLLKGKRAGDSIYSVYLTVDLEKEYFQTRSSGHLFYTPSKIGQSKVFNKLKIAKKATEKKEIFDWMNEYLDYTTYEIAIPSLRNKELAPKGKTGLVVSVLMDYDFISNIQSLGFYEEFKHFAEEKIISVLNTSVYENLKEKVIHQFSSSPLTIERVSGNHEGGITGWAFTNDVIPSITKMTKIKKTCHTPIPDILQAGQWTFSPSGLPISILTGKIAADKAVKTLKKGKKI
ncbi:phytoene desaturase family protein [Lacticigenium naphthae]|uniref:phytoene desaturase family protein n=1 Tax=Lacticigenium naphthae TaxID=515351 RepID=UPI000428D96E|nr:NAD(P)/FAD-dependent oxidoreductase [Lacticigenium naphthae]